MAFTTRSAMVQARVRPEIKFASEHVLRGIGLTMTEAMELFMRRLILDQKLPFEVLALDDVTMTTIMSSWNARGTERKSAFGGERRKKTRLTRRKRE